MKFTLICAGALALAGVAARAGPADMSTQTCSDWLDAGEDEQDQMTAWLRGYVAGRSGASLLDLAGLRADTLTLKRYCQGHATTGLVSAASQWRH